MADDEDSGDIADILSQGDIDALMEDAEVSSDAFGTIFSPEGDRYPADAPIKVTVCDFRNPVFLTESDMRQVRLRHESFIHYLSARLSMFIRMDVSLKMSKLHTLSYEELTETIPTPIFINLFKITGLAGVGVVSVNPRLAMTLVNRMLGGKGHSITDERYLTDIEMALMEDAMRLILEEWCSQWEEMESIEPTIIGRENNGRFLQTSPRDTVMLVLDIEGTLGDCTEMIQIAVPYSMIDPMIKAMKAKAQSLGGAAAHTRGKWRQTYSDIMVPVKAEWNVFDMTVSDLLRLRPGDILELPREIIQETIVSVNNAPQFIGEVGVEDGHVAVKINEIAN